MLLILGTRNQTKALQIRAVFPSPPFVVQSMDEASIEGEAVEDGKTLEENALIKARFAWEQLPPWHDAWVMSDNTGVSIDALNGEPGVKAARWAGEGKTTADIMAYTLERLKGETNRAASFRTVACLISPEGKEYFFSGEVRGRMLEAPVSEPQPNMPYSPIFVMDGQEQVWAQMSVEEENKVSHHGIAFRKALHFLETFI